MEDKILFIEEEFKSISDTFVGDEGVFFKYITCRKNVFINTETYRNIRTNKFSEEEFKFMFKNYLFSDQKILIAIFKKIKNLNIDKIIDYNIYYQFNKVHLLSRNIYSFIVKNSEQPTKDQMLRLLNLSLKLSYNNPTDVIDLNDLIRDFINYKLYNFNPMEEDEDNNNDNNIIRNYEFINDIYFELYNYIYIAQGNFSPYEFYRYSFCPFNWIYGENVKILKTILKMPFVNFNFVKDILSVAYADKDNRRKKLHLIHYLLSTKIFEPQSDIIEAINYCIELVDDSELKLTTEEINYTLSKNLNSSFQHTSGFEFFTHQTIYNKNISQEDKNKIFEYYFKSTTCKQYDNVKNNSYILLMVNFLENPIEIENWFIKVTEDFSNAFLVFDYFKMNPLERYSYPSKRIVRRFRKFKINHNGNSNFRSIDLFTINELRNKKVILNYFLLNYSKYDFGSKLVKVLNAVDARVITLNILQQIQIEFRHHTNISNFNIFEFIDDGYLNQLSEEELYTYKRLLSSDQLIRAKNISYRIIKYLLNNLKCNKEFLLKTFLQNIMRGSCYINISRNEMLKLIIDYDAVFNDYINIVNNTHYYTEDKRKIDFIKFLLPNITIEEFAEFYNKESLNA